MTTSWLHILEPLGVTFQLNLYTFKFSRGVIKGNQFLGEEQRSDAVAGQNANSLWTKRITVIGVLGREHQYRLVVTASGAEPVELEGVWWGKPSWFDGRP